MQNRRKRRFFVVLMMCILTFTFGTICSATGDAAPAEDVAAISATAEDAVTYGAVAAESGTQFTVVYDESDPEGYTDYDLTDGDSALAYVESYADNLEADANLKAHIDTAIAKVRESIPTYATFAVAVSM